MREARPATISVNSPDFTGLCLEILKDGQSIRFAANGLSMTPSIRDGEIVTVFPVDVRDLRIGDVVLYRTPNNRLTAHRVVRRRVAESGVIFGMRGDASAACPEVVPGDRVLGRVAYAERGARKRRLDGRFRSLLQLCQAIVLRIRAKASRKIREASSCSRPD